VELQVNNRENALRLRNRKLEQQNAALLMTLERLIDDLELTESVGCAFAWDFVSTIREHEKQSLLIGSDPAYNGFTEAMEGIHADTERKWNEAIEASK
jgi:hypothetical protein